MQGKRLQVAFLILFGLTLLMFVDVLFSPRAVLLGQQGTDLSAQFVYWYEFGFGQLAQGNPGSLESPYLLGSALLWRLPIRLALSTQLALSGAAHRQGRQCEHCTACAISRVLPVCLDLFTGDCTRQPVFYYPFFTCSPVPSFCIFMPGTSPISRPWLGRRCCFAPSMA